MSHESNHDTAHYSTENKPKAALSSAFWFVLILAGLFIAAVNFVAVMGHDDGGHGAHDAHAPASHHDASPHGGPDAHGNDAHH